MELEYEVLDLLVGWFAIATAPGSADEWAVRERIQAAWQLTAGEQSGFGLQFSYLWRDSFSVKPTSLLPRSALEIFDGLRGHKVMRDFDDSAVQCVLNAINRAGFPPTLGPDSPMVRARLTEMQPTLLAEQQLKRMPPEAVQQAARAVKKERANADRK